MDVRIDSSFASTARARIVAELKKQGLRALLIRSTDHYFNEYVPKALSIRAHATGFDGSMGDAIITTTEAHLFVDGRYSLQARTQSPDFVTHVVSNAQSIEQGWLSCLCEILSPGDTLAYDPRTVDLSLYDKMASDVEKIGARLDENGKNIIDQIMNDVPQFKPAKTSAFVVDSKITGATSREKHQTINQFLSDNNIAGYLTVKLDDIAWLTNLRCYYFPFQSTIPGVACVLENQILFGVAKGVAIPNLGKEIRVVNDEHFYEELKSCLKPSKKPLGINAQECAKAHELALRKHNIPVKHVKNPIASMKAIKNEFELRHLRSAFKKADNAVYQTQTFVVKSFETGQAISEVDVDRNIRNEFLQTGSEELSFRPICASGENGAVIHYGTPDHQKKLAKGSLFLLDTGAYYEGGYATDLTRTFLAAPANAAALPWQKEMFTLVLKASINGLSARIRKGVQGMALDAIVRAPLWRRGLDFAHGTGHGVGINVHEFPPRIGPLSTTELLAGQVFSIEPGLYFEGLGGVRIENLATLVEDPEDDRFLRVLPLTFCPFDERLIDYDLLNSDEKCFLKYFQEQWSNDAEWPDLPPLTRTTFPGH